MSYQLDEQYKQLCNSNSNVSLKDFLSATKFQNVQELQYTISRPLRLKINSNQSSSEFLHERNKSQKQINLMNNQKYGMKSRQFIQMNNQNKQLYQFNNNRKAEYIDICNSMNKNWQTLIQMLDYYEQNSDSIHKRLKCFSNITRILNLLKLMLERPEFSSKIESKAQIEQKQQIEFALNIIIDRYQYQIMQKNNEISELQKKIEDTQHDIQQIQEKNNEILQTKLKMNKFYCDYHNKQIQLQSKCQQLHYINTLLQQMYNQYTKGNPIIHYFRSLNSYQSNQISNPNLYTYHQYNHEIIQKNIQSCTQQEQVEDEQQQIYDSRFNRFPSHNSKQVSKINVCQQYTLQNKQNFSPKPINTNRHISIKQQVLYKEIDLSDSQSEKQIQLLDKMIDDSTQTQIEQLSVKKYPQYSSQQIQTESIFVESFTQTQWILDITKVISEKIDLKKKLVSNYTQITPVKYTQIKLVDLMISDNLIKQKEAKYQKIIIKKFRSIVKIALQLININWKILFKTLKKNYSKYNQKIRQDQNLILQNIKTQVQNFTVWFYDSYQDAKNHIKQNKQQIYVNSVKKIKQIYCNLNQVLQKMEK